MLELFLPSAAVDVVNGVRPVSMLTNDVLAETVIYLNDAYRRGNPVVSDARYDQEFVAELRGRLPEHPFLQAPEPEPENAFVGDRFRHRVSMLSTEKAYTQAEVASFCRAVRAAAAAVGFAPDTVLIRVTPKLDGMAIYDYGDALVSRGRNGFGTDLSRLFSAGVTIRGGRQVGAGELVVVQKYFEEQLREQHKLKHPRNFVAGMAGADNLKPHHLQAIEDKACVLIPYGSLAGVTVPLAAFEQDWERLMMDAQQLEYLCDGAIGEVIDEHIKAEMGSTSHHHRWMVAVKRNDAEATTVVKDVRWTTGRTGRISPTLLVECVQLYGVTVSKVTAHTGAHVERLGLGPGAVVLITRSGSVIPTLLSVTKPAEMLAVAPKCCPSCGSATGWEMGDSEDGDSKENTYLVCTNSASCPAQSSRALEHFFKTLGTAKGFGPAVCEALVAKGITRPLQVYRLGLDDLVAAGISDGVARNLRSELDRSLREPVGDAIFLGAFGIRHLGRGDSRRALEALPIEQLGTLTTEKLLTINGFGEGTAGPIVEGIQKLWSEISATLALGFQLDRTPTAGSVTGTPIAGKTVVFTGTMAGGDRKGMEDQARKLGASVGSSVTGKTDFLICGANVGASKSEKAARLGVKVLSEDEYLAMLAAAA